MYKATLLICTKKGRELKRGAQMKADKDIFLFQKLFQFSLISKYKNIFQYGSLVCFETQKFKNAKLCPNIF